MKAFCEATHNSQSSKRRDPPPKSTQHSTPTGTRNRGLSRTTTATYTLAVHKLQRGPLSVCQNRMPCDLHVHDLIGLRSPSSFFCAGLFRFRVASGRFPFRRDRIGRSSVPNMQSNDMGCNIDRIQVLQALAPGRGARAHDHA